jgi:heme-degrading monooxygenase HmoA
VPRLRTREGLIVTVFRSRLRPEAQEEYAVLAPRISELARRTPGYVSHKTFVAEDGERVTVTEFESMDAQIAWKELPEHLSAQRRGRRELYLEYHIQVCELRRSYGFSSEGGSMHPT